MLQLNIIFIIVYSVHFDERSMKSDVYKSLILCSKQSKIQKTSFTVRSDKEDQQIFMYKKLEAANVW